MGKVVVRTAAIILALLVILVLLIWAVLAAPMFAEFRQKTTSQLLSAVLKQPVEINGDVNVKLRRVSRVHAGGVRIESATMPETDLATLGLLEFDVDLLSLLRAGFDIDNLKIHDLQTNLIVDERDRKSWMVPNRAENDEVEDEEVLTAQEQSAKEDEVDQTNGEILEFLRSRTVEVTSAGLLYDDRTSGFVFDFILENLTFDQLSEGEVLEAKGMGTVNGEKFDLFANIPREGNFTSRAKFGQIELTYDGNAREGGHTGRLMLDTGHLGELFDLLKLDQSFDATGHLEADIVQTDEKYTLSDLDTVVETAKGQEIRVTGSVDELFRLRNIDVESAIRFHPEGHPPAKAHKLSEIKLVEVYAHVTGDKENLKFEELQVSTNAFNRALNQIGPIAFQSVHRTPDNKLAIDGITAQIGPEAAPYIRMEGNVSDALYAKGFDFRGDLDMPASLALAGLGNDVSRRFGGVEASFAVNDASGKPGLTEFEAHTKDTDIWSLDIEAKMIDMTKVNGLDLDLNLDVPDADLLVSALGIKPVNLGPLSFDARIERQDKGFDSSIGMKAGGSDLAVNLSAEMTDYKPVIQGGVDSSLLRMADLRNGVRTLLKLRDLANSENVAQSNVKPLVVPKEPEPAERKDVKPLVLSEEDKSKKPEPAEGGKKVKPLVLSEEDKKPDVFDPVQLLLDSELHIGIDLQKISGPRGASSVSSQLVSNDGQAKLGPVKVTYGKGYFDMTAAMDMVNSPKTVSVSGSTGGWDFGKILDALDVDFAANGLLAGSFNLTGNRTSGKTFINSMYGNAEIHMTNGQVASSLLELAGLGIFPWLFSEERRRGYTDIVCVVAPVTFRGGRASFDSVVAETPHVQLFARGQVDWVRDRIAVRAEPRRVGKPLSRSAWPFEVTGKLSDPKFKLDIGGSRSHRADGAEQMPANRRPCVPDIYQLK